MDMSKRPEDPGGMKNGARDGRRESFPAQHGAVSYPSLPTMPEVMEHSVFTPSDLPISPAIPTPRSLKKMPSSGSLKSVTTTSLRKKSSLTSLKGTNTPPMSPVSRRQSAFSTGGLSSLPSPRSSLPPPAEEPMVIIPEEFAKEAFEREMRAAQDGSAEEAELLVVVHDACYGHRFSRPRTSKASLSTIVERPERVLAIIRGLSMAYVRLGSRHAGGKYAPNPREPVPPPPFNIRKSTRSIPLDSPAVTQVHGVEWMKELTSMCDGAETRLALDGRELTRAPGLGPNGQPKPMLHEGDLYLCAESLQALQGALGGVCDAVDAIFGPGAQRRAFACVRPPGHHCAGDFPSGFCWLNNVHIGIAHAMQDHGLTHAAIIDFDLHHGDGSQEITWAHNSRINCMHKNVSLSKKSPIGYFSLHDINSYPCEGGDIDKVQNASLCIENAHGQTIWNVHLQPWKTEDEFWSLYETRYRVLIHKMRDFLRNHCEKLEAARRTAQAKLSGRIQEVPLPKAAIFISAGFDASEWEGVGMQRHKVNVPTDFYARFTRDVINLSDEAGLGVDGRVISVLEGGYSDRALSSGVFSHICGMTAQRHDDVKADLADQLAGLSMRDTDGRLANAGPCEEVDMSWWSPAHLDEFDEAQRAKPTVPTSGVRKPPRINTATYITPTAASSAKALPPRRSLPASHRPPPPPKEPSPPARPPTPPPPDPVSWGTAANELAKVIVPQDRQTESCKPEELAPPRQRRQRQSDIGIVRPESVASVASNSTGEGKRSGLRERKTKPRYCSDDEEKPKKAGRAPSRANRRKTMGGPKASPKKEQSSPIEPDFDAPPLPALSLIPLPASRLKSQVKELNDFAGPSIPVPPLERALSESQVPQQSLPRPESASGDHRHAYQDGPENPGTNGVDSLANGMKKMSIKLKVPSREEYERREQEREQEEFQQQQQQQHVRILE